MENKTKYALVTGGSRGIGRAVCVQLAKDFDYKILINYNSNAEAAKQSLKQVEEVGGSGVLLQFDVANAEAVKKALDHWQNDNKNAIIEVIINNAGITKDGLFMWMNREDWSDVIDTSLSIWFRFQD